MTNLRKILLVCLSLFLIIGYFKVEESRGGDSVKTIKDISPEQWEKLAKQKIYFGHQSVGYNIMDGIRAVMDEHPEIQLNIIETRDLATIDVGVFSHSKVGKNRDPVSKTDDFVKIIKSGVGDKADIAFHKYCYIDANANTDVEKVFLNYKEQINNLKSKYPRTRFIHITMPLTTVQTGLKTWIKKILGKPISGIDANIKRNMFNQLLLNTYQLIDPVFEFATAEATQPDGTMTTFEKDGKEYLTLYKGYSNDGGHLNKQGQKAIAERLLIFLVKIKP
ncbi:MAG: SGNH/GDSL hydrolase family protein [Bacteroidales bacterium]|nr:SGNH/GDSL hydrolase family protein [Bacteroidales bacterium]